MESKPTKPRAGTGQKRVTMSEVAFEAGVGQATVSFVLNGREDMRISRETRKRVIDAAKKLGYRPRGVGRPPAELAHGVIGLMIDEVATSPFAMITIEGAQEEAWTKNVIVEVVMSGHDKEYEAAVLKKWSAEKVQGVIYSTILTRSIVPPDALAMHRSVLLNCYDEPGRYPSVVPAERRGGEVATRALLDSGCRRIAYISGEPWMEASQQRQEGYERALRQSGLPVREQYIAPGNFLPSGGRSATKQLFALDEPPDAIFTGNDLAAVGCYEALREMGIRPGEDVQVVGYDNQLIAQHINPALSTVVLPHRELGAWAVNAILSEGALPEGQERVECPFVPRQSHQRGG